MEDMVMQEAEAVEAIRGDLLVAQKNEISEYMIYTKLAKYEKDMRNSVTLEKIGREEYEHYKFWRQFTGTDVKPNRVKIFFYTAVARLFGLTFGVKLMELGEEQAQINYREIERVIPEARSIINDEDTHEKTLISIIEEERLSYVGSMVLGLNDALVELTGSLAGLSFALRDTHLIAMAGLVTGIAASFSMAASEYLSKRSDEGAEGKKALTSALYTGGAYIVTVVLLILPFLLAGHYLVALPLTVITAMLIILVFNFYISVAKDYDFGKRFGEMAIISLGVTALSFGVGVVIRSVWGVEV
jgi:VIT1/CCC1 family predicted Fe2+/Mn2+ transporter